MDQGAFRSSCFFHSLVLSIAGYNPQVGILNQDLQNFEGAFKLFIKAVKVNPKGFEALNNLGTIHLRNKNYDLAIKCLNKSLEIKNNYVPSINNLAGYYHKANKPKQALEFSSRSMDLQPENPMTKNQYAKALIINSRLDEAIAILEKLIEEAKFQGWVK